MGFDRGSIAFRVCLLPQQLPQDAVARFAANAAGPLTQVYDEPSWGWVTGRFLLETDITDENSLFGSYIHVCLRQAEKKIPGSLMTAECRLEELVQMRARKVDHLNRKAIKEIKEEVDGR